MNHCVAACLDRLRVGEPTAFRRMTVFPLFSDGASGPSYITLAKALAQGTVRVAEVSEGGSVPDLKVVSTADTYVFLFDGEELAGAKQNRVLNSSILLPEKSETLIPVSCTEQGRWGYVSREFSHSGHVMHSRGRARKSRSVHESLEHTGEYRSDQMEVWAGVDELRSRARVLSATGAMRDVYEARGASLAEYVAAFPCAPGQCGLLAFLGRDPLGLDLLSRPDAYAEMHPRLVSSYATEAAFPPEPESETPPSPGPEDAATFLGFIPDCKESEFSPVGLGTDCRYAGSTLVGSALVHDETVIHAAFFPADPDAADGRPIAGWQRRRRYRMH